MTQEVAGSSPADPTWPVSSVESAASNDRRGAGSTPARATKLYAVTRADLPVGLRTAQVGHALITWALRYGQPPDNLVVLQVPDLQALEKLHSQLNLEVATQKNEVVGFREPDLQDELTAIAAGAQSWRMLSSGKLLR